MFVGIDVSASRGLDLCAIDDRRRVSALVKARDIEALEPILRAMPPEATFAVDAPSGPSRGPGERAAERELRRLGVPLYAAPASEASAPAWMRHGFAIYRALDRAGHPLFAGGEPRPGVAIEVYPHLSYVALTGTRRGAVPKLEWTRAALRGRVTGLGASADQDALDAACAALTAWHFAAGRWVGYGDPDEGVIVAPQPVRDLARAEPAMPNQLALPIETTALPRRVVAPARRTFADRVVGIAAGIPSGRVATYGDVARWAGKPAAARAVGTILAARAWQVPCHRVVSVRGAPPPFPTDAAERLRGEGVPLRDGRVDLGACRWSGPP